MIDLGEAERIRPPTAAAFRAALTGKPEVRGSEGIWPGEIAAASAASDRAALAQAISLATRCLTYDDGEVALSDADNLGKDLRRLILDPLLPALGERNRLFVAPNRGPGPAAVRSVAYYEDNRFVIDDYIISYLGVVNVLRFGRTPTGPPAPAGGRRPRLRPPHQR